MKKFAVDILFGMLALSALLLSSCGRSAPNGKDSQPQGNETIAARTEAVDLSDESERHDTARVSDSASADETETAATETAPVKPGISEETSEKTDSGILIVYFSHTGKTKPVAEYIQGLVGGNLVRLEPASPYPEGYSAALDPAKQEQRENARPKIKNTIEHFDSYKTVYLGYPIWWGTVPMLVNTFLESYDFSGKTVVPFATSGGTGISQSIQDIRSEVPDADVKDGLLVKNNKDIIPWLRKLGLYE